MFNPSAQEIVDFVRVADDGRRISQSNPFEAATSQDRIGFFLPDKATPYPATQSPLERAFDGESVYDAEVFCCLSESNEGKWISITARPVVDEQEGLRGRLPYFAISQSVSKLRKL